MTKPSKAKTPHGNGFYSTTPNGWYDLPESVIVGDGYEIKFSRFIERTIDRNCDALNGYHAEPTSEFCVSFYNSNGFVRNIHVKSCNDADKLYDIFSNPVKPFDEALSSFYALANFIADPIRRA